MGLVVSGYLILNVILTLCREIYNAYVYVRLFQTGGTFFCVLG